MAHGYAHIVTTCRDRKATFDGNTAHIVTTCPDCKEREEN